MSEDRREQVRAGRLLAGIVLVAIVVVTAMWIRLSARDPLEQKQPVAAYVSQSAPPHDSTVAAVAPAPTPPEPTKDADTASPSQPELRPKELQRLNDQRKDALEIISTINSILSTPSFADRVEIFCRYKFETLESLTGGQIEARYRELLRAKPATREGEIQRQQQLEMVEGLMSNRREHLRECQWSYTYNAEKMPSDEEFRERIVKAQGMLTDADQQLAGRK